MARAYLSRVRGNPLAGKRTASVSARVPDEFKQELHDFWRALGYSSESDFIFELLIVAVRGPDGLTNLHRQRISSLVRNVGASAAHGASEVPDLDNPVGFSRVSEVRRG